MANTLGNYNPALYAQEGLIQLENALGMASRVHLGYDEERGTFGLGDTINIRKPAVFTVNDAPATAEDLATKTSAITLDKWREVKFKLSDKELAYTSERIIQEHIRPAAYQLANDIDLKLTALYKDIPWFVDASGSGTAADLADTRKELFNLGVPLNDPGRVHMMLDGIQESKFLQNSAFAQQQGAGDTGVTTQRVGHLGTKYGFETFANQNVQTHTKGTASVTALLTNGTPAKGATTANLDAAAVTGTLVPGDSFVIAGNTQRYAVTALNTAASNAFTGVTFVPGLAAAPGDGAAVTVSLDDHTASLGFHRNAFALAMAKLPDELPRALGAQVASVQHPNSGVALRARMYYVGNSSEVHVAMDVLYGVKTLEPNLACRLRG